MPTQLQTKFAYISTAGRRRKSGSSAPDPHSPKSRGLFYNEDDEYEESIFLPVTPQPEEKK